MPPPGSPPRPDPGHGGGFRPARPGLRCSRGWEEPRRGCAGGGSQAPRAADGSVRISRVGGGAGPHGAEAGPQGRRGAGPGTVATRGGVRLRAEAWTGRAGGRPGDVDPCASAGERDPRSGGVPRPSAPVILTLACRDLGAAPPFPLSLQKCSEGCSDQGIGLSLREGHCLHF